MRLHLTIFFIALCAVWMPAIGQNDLKSAAEKAASCPEAKDLVNTDLFGAWTLELQSNAGAAVTTRLTLERNPEFAESLAGFFLQGNIRHEVFGDIEAGVLDLEESSNGKDIIAIWKGRVVSGGCSPAIAGSRRIVGAAANTQAEQSFVLRRAGW